MPQRFAAARRGWSGAPVVVPATDGDRGRRRSCVARRGRAWRWRLQLCLALPPGELRIVGPLRGENAWAERLPHRGGGHRTDACLAGPGETVAADADIIDRAQAPGAPHPPAMRGVTVTVALAESRASRPSRGEVSAVDVEGRRTRAGACSLAEELAARADEARVGARPTRSSRSRSAQLLAMRPPPRGGACPR